MANFPYLKQQRRSEKLLSLLEPEFDEIYDLLFQLFGVEESCLEIMQRILRRTASLYRKEQFDRYLRLWFFRVAIREVEKSYSRFLSNQDTKANFPYLNLEEKIVVLLHDRMKLKQEEIAAAMQRSPSRVGRSLAYAREKIARFALGVELKNIPHKPCEHTSLLARVELNRNWEREKIDLVTKCAYCQGYLKVLEQSHEIIRSLPAKKFTEIENTVRAKRFLPIFESPKEFQWSALSWRTKLALEAMILLVIASTAVFVAPRVANSINTRALLAGRFSDVVRSDSFEQKQPDLPTINTERLLASTDMSEQAISSKAEKDEFADMEFPSGDSYEAGAAPVAPSRLGAAVFRLIVQSSNPRDLIPQMHSLFVEEKIKERDSSGRIMPGGVYFDGITKVGDYDAILEKIEKLGKTKTYSNPATGRNPDERARLIVWIQQI